MTVFARCSFGSLKLKLAWARCSPFSSSMGAGIVDHQFGGSTCETHGIGGEASALLQSADSCASDVAQQLAISTPRVIVRQKQAIKILDSRGTQSSIDRSSH